MLLLNGIKTGTVFFKKGSKCLFFSYSVSFLDKRDSSVCNLGGLVVSGHVMALGGCSMRGSREKNGAVGLFGGYGRGLGMRITCRKTSRCCGSGGFWTVGGVGCEFGSSVGKWYHKWGIADLKWCNKKGAEIVFLLFSGPLGGLGFTNARAREAALFEGRFGSSIGRGIAYVLFYCITVSVVEDGG